MRRDLVKALSLQRGFWSVLAVAACVAVESYYQLVFVLGQPPMYAYALLGAWLVISALAAAWRLPAALAHFAGAFAAALLVAPVWLAPVLALFACRIRRLRGLVAVSLLAVLVAAASRFVQRYGLSAETLLAVVQTHGAEGVDFVLANLDLRVLAYVAAFTLMAWASRVRPGEGAGATTGPRSGAFLLAFALGLVAVVPQVPMARDAWRRTKHLPSLVPVTVEATPARDIEVVLLLGESTSRWHLQAYGYPYPTTPGLVALGDRAIKLTDAVSAYSDTVQSLTSLFYRATGIGAADESLIARLKAMGVRTAWYSTQSGLGPWDSPVRQIAAQADSLRFFKDREPTLPRGLGFAWGLGHGFSADADMTQALLEDLDKARAGGPVLRVAHFTAAHGDYCRVTPHEAREVFEGQHRGAEYFGAAPDRTRDVNCHDAAIRHVDGMVTSVMQTADRTARPVVVIFAPDHGEDPDGGTAHAAGLHSARHVEIPLVVHFNPAAQQVLGDAERSLRRHAEAPMFLPWLHESLLDLYGGRGLWRDVEALSMFSEHFTPDEREMFASDMPLDYDHPSGQRADYLELTRLTLSRFRKSAGPVRTALVAEGSNSELALQEAAQSFDGVEVDVVFNEATSQFEVWHPPVASHLTLQRALEVMKNRPDATWWLDWKNPSVKNLPAAVAALDRLDQTYAVKRRTFVETTVASEVVLPPSLTEAGYRHAINFQASGEAKRECRSSPGGQACQAATAGAGQQVRAARAGWLSFDLRDQDAGRALLARLPGVRALTWDFSIDVSKPWSVRALQELTFADGAVVRFPTRFAPMQADPIWHR